MKNYRYSSPSSIEQRLNSQLSTLKSPNRDKVLSKELSDLSTDYKNLEYRYTLLQQEKNRNEIEFMSRNEITKKTIANLKTELDSHKNLLNSQRSEFRDMMNDIRSLKEIGENREKELNRLKQENQEIIEENKKLNKDNRDKEFIKESMNSEFKKMKEIINELEGDRKEKRMELERKNKIINESEKKTNELLKDIKKEIQEKNEIRREIEYLQDQYRKEIKKVNELENDRKNLEEKLRLKENLIDQIKTKNDEIQLNNNRIISEFKLEKQGLDRKIENLITLNNELMSDLAHSNTLDENLLSLYSRKISPRKIETSSIRSPKNQTRFY